ncbi:MAG: hypothetical protein HRU20_09950 [Pseudomonadales bacterium]|nr:hypothetical protein [Pseudomonadales bacterium]
MKAVNDSVLACKGMTMKNLMVRGCMAVVAVLLLCNCAETPNWTPGLVVDEMTTLQVAHKEVIDNPAEGVASALDAEKALSAMAAYRAPAKAEGKSQKGQGFIFTPSSK